MYLPTTSFALLCALVVGIAAWEWAGCAGLRANGHKFCYVLAILIGIGVCLNYRSTAFIVAIIYLALLWWVVAFWAVARYQARRAIKWLSTPLKALCGVFVLLPAWCSLTLLHETGYVPVLCFFMLVWGADIAAFFAGRMWGRHKLASNLSPGKSWEGVGGALASSFLPFIVAVSYYEMTLVGALWCGVIMLLTVGFSVLGDLVESLFKRMAGLKDSGHILPGHGGVLDRIDSLVAAAPVFFVGFSRLAPAT